MLFKFVTPLTYEFFEIENHTHPDSYYMGECEYILCSLCDKFGVYLYETYVTGCGGQGCGYLFKVYEFINPYTDEKDTIDLYVDYNAYNIEIKSSSTNETEFTGILYNEWINNIRGMVKT
jgi:hypothetical protein